MEVRNEYVRPCEETVLETEDYFFFIYAFGMGYAEVFIHVELAAREAELKFSYINAVQMVDNYLPIFDMEDQIATLPEKDVEGQLERNLR